MVVVRPLRLCLWSWYGPGARYLPYETLVPVTVSGPGVVSGRASFSAHGVAQVPVTASRRDMRPFGLRMERRILIRHFAPLQPKQTASPNPKMRPTSHDSKVSCPIMSTNRNIHNTGRQSQSQVVPLQGDLPILW